MAVDLKDTLRHWLDGDTPLNREGVEVLRAAGLIAPVGYQITEIGRTLMVQNPPTPDNPQYLIEPGRVELNQTFGKLGPAQSHLMYPGTVQLLDNLTTMVNDITGTPQPKGGPEKSAKDAQVGGDHYKKLGHHQPWEVLATWMTPAELRGYMKGTVIAYLAREQDKGGDTDVAKALHTMQLWQDVRKDK